MLSNRSSRNELQLVAEGSPPAKAALTGSSLEVIDKAVEQYQGLMRYTRASYLIRMPEK